MSFFVDIYCNSGKNSTHRSAGKQLLTTMRDQIISTKKIVIYALSAFGSVEKRIAIIHSYP